MDSTVEEAGVRRGVATSHKILVLWSKIKESSSLNIEGFLNAKEWDDLMLLLRYEDVSGIEHLTLSINYGQWDERSWLKLAGHRVTGLGTVLGTGRFSALKMLVIDLPSFRFDPYLRVKLRDGSGIGGNQITDGLDEDINFKHIFKSLVEGRVSQLTSLSIHSARYQLSLAQKLDVLLKSGSLINLRHLTIGGEIFARPEWRVLTNAIKYDLLPHLKSLKLISLPWKQHLNLADLVEEAGKWFSSLENLAIVNSDSADEQVFAVVNGILKLPKRESALKSLSVPSTSMDRTTVNALINLVASSSLPQLEELDLSRNPLLTSGATVFARLVDSVRGGLKTFNWSGNEIGADGEGAKAIANAYFENEAFTADILIDWHILRA